MDKMYVGVDIGSISVNVALLNKKGKVLKDWYVRTEGKPLEKTHATLTEMLEQLRLPDPAGEGQAEKRQQRVIAGMAVTGSGGRLLSDILGIPFVNEVIAQAEATGRMYPEVKTVIEIGGEDSKFINIDLDSSLGTHVVRDFEMNTVCAAGTGSFLDQQAARLKLTIEEFSEFGLKSDNPPRIAGRCSVFANTDMIHLQQEATPVEDIVAGLCSALARNFRSVIAKGKEFPPPISFQGGVAYNKGMIKAFREALKTSPDEFIVPEHVASMGAIGCALREIHDASTKSGQAPSEIRNPGDLFQKIPEFLANRHENYKPLKPLKREDSPQPIVDSPQTGEGERERHGDTEMQPVWVGIDIGSISTNVVLIDSEKQLVARRYLWTSGRPIDAVMRGLKEIGAEAGNRVEVKGVGTTGSGRYMIGDLIGADVVKNEITSQARASAEIDPEVDTIFEIGGQDSKYISLRDGVIVDFEMNKVCAAGTGSFLEEQAERLDLNIVEEFANCAFKGTAPVNLGERCTVFMQSQLTSWQQKGAKREDLAAGLAYSIAHNYLNRVVANKKIGDNLFFQGAVAHNKAIVSAFNEVLGKPVHVPPNNDVTGAIGVAIIAMEYMQKQEKIGKKETTFRGFDLCEKEYDIERFDCDGCPNQCEIKKVNIKGEEPLYYGSRCDKYEKKQESKSKRKDASLPATQEKQVMGLFKIREQLLLKSYEAETATQGKQPIVGIPRALMFHEYLPFWAAFFKELGCTVVLSDSTNKGIIHRGVESCVSDHCFPIKACHGHVLNLVDKGVDYIFLPSLINMEKEQPNIRESYACPFIQAVPYVIKAALDLKGIELLTPILHLKREKKHLVKALTQVAGKLGRGKREALHALSAAELAQGEFYRSVKAKGANVLREIGKSNRIGVVIVGRPYNTCDMGLNLNIPKILEDMEVPAIPVDFLPTESVDISDNWANMYWQYGQRILAAARVIRDNPNLYALYVTNFGCGADSFVQRYFEHEIGKKPHLILEVDEHSAPAGVITRCEAFLDSIQNKQTETVPEMPDSRIERREDHTDRTLLIPFMGNHSYAVAAAFRHCGIDSEVIPIADQDSVELGRKHSTGKECYPCIITTGDMIKVLESGKWDHNRVAFFMPEASGPCRFGQYNKLQRLILKEAGYEDVCIVSPNQAKNMYKTVNQYGADFNKRSWFSLCAIDILDKLVRAARPYEVEKGQADRVYQECLDRICQEIEGKGNIFGVMREIKERFKSVPVKHEPRPFIGISGEIYVRNHHFSNENLIRTIEELGGEVVTSTTAEWLFYINARQKEQCMIDRNYAETIQYAVKDKWQRWTEHKMAKEFEGFLEYLEEPTIKQLFSYSNPYLHQSVEGEATLTVAKCLDFMKKKADGLITIMPFSCMPGTNASAIMEGIKKEHSIPYLNLVYDGLEQSTTQTRLEAFMHQAQQYMTRKDK